MHKIDLALFICNTVQADIPLPENETQNKDYLEAFLQMFTSMDRPSSGYIALGLNDLNKRRNFAKANGDLAEWLNWYPGQPNSAAENYVAMATSGKPGRWHDFNQNTEVHVFCEMAL